MAQFKDLINEGKVSAALHLRTVREIRSKKADAISIAVKHCEAAFGGDWDALYDLEHGHESDGKPSPSKLTVGGTRAFRCKFWPVRWHLRVRMASFLSS